MLDSQFDEIMNTDAMPAMEQLFGVSACLVRQNGKQTEPFAVRREDIDAESIDARGFGSAVQIRKWMIPVASCIVSGAESPPQNQDRIYEVDANGNNVGIWKIIIIGEGQVAAKMEPGGYDYSCFAQYVGTN